MKREKAYIFGEIVDIYPVQRFESGFQKRKFVLRTTGDYSQDLLFELHHDKADIIESYQEGDFIKVFYDIKGNQGKDGKHYTNLIAWRLEFVG